MGEGPSIATFAICEQVLRKLWLCSVASIAVDIGRTL
jgi:hypothetical protein